MKALIRLRGCAGWSAPLLFACSCIKAHIPVVRGHRFHFPNYFVGQTGLMIFLIVANNTDPDEMV